MSSISLPSSLPPSSVSYLSQSSVAESLSGSILLLKQEGIELDARRQELMQSLAVFRRTPVPIIPFIQLGPGMGFMKINTEDKTTTTTTHNKNSFAAIKHLIEEEQTQLNARIEEIRVEIKEKLRELQQIKPSSMPKELVEFVTREKKRTQEGKEFELKEEEIGDYKQE